MTGTKRVTIKDIARVAGVSTAAVSHALRPAENSNIKLLPDTVARVQAVAEQMNYRPHAGARSIRSKKFGTIGYFHAKKGLYTHTPDGYLAGVHDVAEDHVCRLVLIRLPQKIEEIEQTVPSVFKELNLDALVIESYSEIALQLHEQLRMSKLPVIYLNDKHETNSCYVDDVLGAQLATEHLYKKGYRKICILLREIENGVPWNKMHYSAQDRLNGFLKAVEKYKLDGHLKIIRLPETVGLDVDLSDSDWEAIKDYEAILCFDDDLANTVGRYCYNNNIRIPEDMALASFNADYGSLCAWKRLTTVKIPSYEMGRAAARMAFEMLGEPMGTSLKSIVFKPELVVGNTT